MFLLGFVHVPDPVFDRCRASSSAVSSTLQAKSAAFNSSFTSRKDKNQSCRSFACITSSPCLLVDVHGSLRLDLADCILLLDLRSAASGDRGTFQPSIPFGTCDTRTHIAFNIQTAPMVGT
ncbi:uncharacterized protein LOC142765082 [Rhipicephalus microplus]|uniref:uncharacterized protein LOC142765082 n=1 Tax=Rhipicephalus microplus TaxID=6941 RepID=UPI003F6AD538